jgi:hypothetical protein
MPVSPAPRRAGGRTPEDLADVARSTVAKPAPLVARPIVVPSRSVRGQLRLAKVFLIVFGLALGLFLAVAISGALR